MLSFLDSRLPRAGLDRIHVLAIRRPASRERRTFLPLPHFDHERYFGIGVFYSVQIADRGLLQTARSAQKTLLEQCLRCGGRPYLCGAHDLDESDIEAIYGDEFREIQKLCRQLDPSALFNQPQKSPLRPERR